MQSWTGLHTDLIFGDNYKLFGSFYSLFSLSGSSSVLGGGGGGKIGKEENIYIYIY